MSDTGHEIKEGDVDSMLGFTSPLQTQSSLLYCQELKVAQTKAKLIL